MGGAPIPPVTEDAQGGLFTPPHEGFLGGGHAGLIAENMFQGVVFMVNSRPLRLKPSQQIFDAFYLFGLREGSSPGTGEHLGGEVVERYGDLSEPKSAGSVFKGFVWRSFVLRK